MARSPIRPDINLRADGKHLGYLRLAHSVHRSAYGFIPIPIAVIAAGAGPTVLLMAGNHGDEYEGQALLSTLIRELTPDDVSGRLVILPMANFPAAQAGLRTSPIDEGNLNRSFPGDPGGGPTAAIADYIENTLLTEADFLFDLHSGGSSLLYEPTLILSRFADDPNKALKEAIIQDFGLPNALLYPRDLKGAYSSSAAQRQDVCGVTAELGGAGMIDSAFLKMAKDGLIRCLNRIGLLKSAPPPSAVKTTRFRREALVYADMQGLFEPLVGPGQAVSAGQMLALIHEPETPGAEPVEAHAAHDGVVLAKRVPARVIRGDCLFHIGRL
ncbi:MAG: succinylglutamate desuccinylase/aspartoacylase family protein [Alphaproteobacteria bacterium]|nr:succinylglutamate desuccinylase/aspartoacylase family protein [Alphaproteobacteria bacterium]